MGLGNFFPNGLRDLMIFLNQWGFRDSHPFTSFALEARFLSRSTVGIKAVSGIGILEGFWKSYLIIAPWAMRAQGRRII